MKTSFTKMISTVFTRMQDGQRQEVRAALKAGAQPLSLGRYSAEGALVLRVERPVSWQGETHDRFRHLPLSCIVPADVETQTQTWFAKRHHQ